MQSRPLNLNFEERGVWNAMKRALKEHNSYNVRQNFYPQNMDSWKKDHKEIEQTYRELIIEMISIRMKFEREEKQREMEEKQRENELEAAKAILLIKMREEVKKARAENKENRKNTLPVRRSSRISNK